jgi:hypothetical protein
MAMLNNQMVYHSWNLSLQHFGYAMVQLNAFGPSDPLSQAASAHVVNLRIRHIFQVPF